MHGRCFAELEAHQLASRALFSEAAGLIEKPMLQVVQRGQQILDAVLAGLGVPGFQLIGATNHVGFLVGQLHAAGRGECADLSIFWELLD
jgi:hypothetical protein